MTGRAIVLAAIMMLAACSPSKPSPEDNGSNIAPASSPAPAAPALSEADRAAVDAAVEAIYARYRKPPELNGEGELAPTVGYARPLAAMVARWRAAQPGGEIDSVLSDADWFCQCQDWLGTGFRFLEKTIRPLPDGQVEARIRFDLGDGMAQRARILFAREGSDWKVADLFSPAVPRGLLAQMSADVARWDRK